MTLLQERSLPLNARIAAGRSVIRPISRLRFEVTDRDAFDQCIRLVVSWMNSTPRGTNGPRSGISLPREAFTGDAFNISDEFGANPTRAVRLDAMDGAIWAARLDYPDPNNPCTWVSEFYVKRTTAQPVEFGAQLTCIMRGDCPPFDITRPNIVREIIGELSAEADGRQLADRAETVGPAEIEEFVDLLQAPDRRLPIIAVSEDEFGNKIKGLSLSIRLNYI